MSGNFGQSTNICIITCTLYVAYALYNGTNYLLLEFLDVLFFHRMVMRQFDRKDILF